MVLVHNHIVPPGLISLLCQLLAPRLELLQHRCRLFRRRGLLRQFGSLVVGDGRRLVSKVMFQGRLRGCRSCPPGRCPICMVGSSRTETCSFHHGPRRGDESALIADLLVDAALIGVV
jgi:hypothetical protein